MTSYEIEAKGIAYLTPHKARPGLASEVNHARHSNKPIFWTYLVLNTISTAFGWYGPLNHCFT